MFNDFKMPEIHKTNWKKTKKKKIYNDIFVFFFFM